MSARLRGDRALPVLLLAVLQVALLTSAAAADSDHRLPHERSISSLDDGWLAVSERAGRVFVSDVHGDRVVVTDLAGRPVDEVRGLAAPEDVELSPDGRTLAVALRAGGAVALVDVDTLSVRTLPAPAGACPTDLAWVGVTVHALTACPRNDGVTGLFVLDTVTRAVSFPAGVSRYLPTEHDGIVTPPAGGGLVLTVVDEHVRVWRWRDGDYEPLADRAVPGAFRDRLAVDASGDVLGVATAQGQVRRFSLPGLAELASLETVAYGNRLAMSPTDDRVAVAAGYDGGSGSAPARLRIHQRQVLERELAPGGTMALEVGPSGRVYAVVKPRDSADSWHLLVLAPGATATRLLIAKNGLSSSSPLGVPGGPAATLVEVDGSALAGRKVSVVRRGPDGTVELPEAWTDADGRMWTEDAPPLVGAYRYRYSYGGEPGRAATGAEIAHEVLPPSQARPYDDEGHLARDIATDRRGRVWLAQPGADRVLVLDEQLARVATIPAVPGATSLALTPDGTRMLVAAQRSDEVVEIDTSTLLVVSRRSVQPAYQPRHLATDGRFVYLGYCGPRPSDPQDRPQGSLAWYDRSIAEPEAGPTPSPSPSPSATPGLPLPDPLPTASPSPAGSSSPSPAATSSSGVVAAANGVHLWRHADSPPCLQVAADAGRTGRVVASSLGPGLVLTADLTADGTDLARTRTDARRSGPPALLDDGRTAYAGVGRYAADDLRLRDRISSGDGAASIDVVGQTILVGSHDTARAFTRGHDRLLQHPWTPAGTGDGGVAAALALDEQRGYVLHGDRVLVLDLAPGVVQQMTISAPGRVVGGTPVRLAGRLTEKVSGQGIGGASVLVRRIDGSVTTLAELTTAPDGSWSTQDLPVTPERRVVYEARHVGTRAWAAASATTDVTSAPSPTSPPVAPSDGFSPLVPSRVLDSRDGTGGVRGRLVDGRPARLVVTGRGGVPSSGVRAVVLNVTATGASSAGHLTVYPGDTSAPRASNLNFARGQTVPNLVVVPVAADGSVRLVANDGGPHVIADVVGWYGPRAEQRFAPLAPSRVLDSRDGTGGVRGRLADGRPARLVVTGRGGVPTSGVRAVVLNVTVTGASSAGHLTVYPDGTSAPRASNLNFVRGQTVPNLVVVPVATDGSVRLLANDGGPHVIADVVGWYGPGADQLFAPLAPSRVLDSRDGTGDVRGPLVDGRPTRLVVTGRGGVPESAVRAVVLNVTVTGASSPGHLTVYAGPVPPHASNLNFVRGQTVPNLVVVPVAADGSVKLLSNTGSPHVIADVVGWFAP